MIPRHPLSGGRKVRACFRPSFTAGWDADVFRAYETAKRREAMTDFEALAREIGFDQAGMIDVDAVVTSAELAASCNPGACRKYASCWTCPPGAGTYEELLDDITSRRAGIVVQTIRDGVDYFEDWDILAETRSLHNERLDRSSTSIFRTRRRGRLKQRVRRGSAACEGLRPA